MASIFGKAKEKVKSGDLFGQPVQLTYKGTATFNTCCGGLVSILFVTAMMAVFAMDLTELLMEPEYANYAPTYEYTHKFDIDKLHSMLAIKVRGRDSEGKLLARSKVNKDIRVAF